ncbi:MAG TPA: GNAT family N-acetyltransferase [Gemmatimonadales bacterium]|nr:GNAT family N-acetyltransferase [Gemmatimonadales bacterium]
MLVIEAEPPADWEAYARARGSFYHLPQWAECLRSIYRIRLEFFSVRPHWWPGCTEGLQGMMAVAEIPPLLGPRRLVSLPFSYAAGPLASDPAIADELVIALRDHARWHKIPRVEVKSRGEYPPPQGYHRVQHYATYEVPIDGGEAEVWKRLHPGSTQRSIRKGEKAGVVVRKGETVKDWLVMAKLEEHTAHSHGLPAPPRNFFTEGCRQLQAQGLADVYLAFTRTGKEAAAITVWKGPRAWIYGFGASNPAYLDQRPNHVLLWAALKDAIAAGCAFDLGRVAPEQAGLLEFKRRWGGQAIPLAYDYWPEPGGLNVAARDRGVLATAASVWSRLPAPMARLGSRLYRYLG